MSPADQRRSPSMRVRTSSISGSNGVEPAIVTPQIRDPVLVRAGKRVEQVASREDLDASVVEILVLRPDW